MPGEAAIACTACCNFDSASLICWICGENWSRAALWKASNLVWTSASAVWMALVPPATTSIFCRSDTAVLRSFQEVQRPPEALAETGGGADGDGDDTGVALEQAASPAATISAGTHRRRILTLYIHRSDGMLRTAEVCRRGTGCGRGRAVLVSGAWIDRCIGPTASCLTPPTPANWPHSMSACWAGSAAPTSRAGSPWRRPTAASACHSRPTPATFARCGRPATATRRCRSTSISRCRIWPPRWPTLRPPARPSPSFSPKLTYASCRTRPGTRSASGSRPDPDINRAPPRGPQPPPTARTSTAPHRPGHPHHHLGDEFRAGAEVQPDESVALRAKGWTGADRYPAVGEERGRRIRQTQLPAVQPGQIGGPGREPVDLGQVFAQPVGEQRAIAIQLGDHGVQPLVAGLECRLGGEDAEISDVIRERVRHAPHHRPGRGVGGHYHRALQTRDVERLGAGGHHEPA